MPNFQKAGGEKSVKDGMGQQTLYIGKINRAHSTNLSNRPFTIPPSTSTETTSDLLCSKLIFKKKLPHFNFTQLTGIQNLQTVLQTKHNPGTRQLVYNKGDKYFLKDFTWKGSGPLV